MENFEYLTKSNIFKSIGYIKIEDIKNNIYEFSQVYIDTKKREVIGTDIKAFLNNEQFKINEKINFVFLQMLLKLKETKIYLKKKYFYIM